MCEVKPGLTNSALAAGLRVHPHDRVLDRVEAGDTLAVPQRALAAAALGEVVAELPVAVVHRGELLGQPLHRARTATRRRARGPPSSCRRRTAAAYGPQDRAERRPLHERDVGVPDVGEPVVGAVEGVDLRVGLVDAGDHRVRRGQSAQAVAQRDLAVVGRAAGRRRRAPCGRSARAGRRPPWRRRRWRGRCRGPRRRSRVRAGRSPAGGTVDSPGELGPSPAVVDRHVRTTFVAGRRRRR